MNIIVVGCGKIGSTLVESLSAEGHDVVALEKDAHVLEQITNMYDVMGVCGNGADCEILEEAAVDKAELVVAATGSDEMNMLCCFFARKMGAKHTIARVRNPEYNDRSLGFMRQQLNLSMSINPELLTAQELFNILKVPSAVKIEYFSGRNFEMAELRLREDSILDGIRLIDLQKKYHTRVLICAVARQGETIIPSGDFTLRAGDKIYLTAAPRELEKFFRLLGVFRARASSVMIVGASKMCYYLASELLEMGMSVKIIDQNEQRCVEMSEKLPRALVIVGDGTDSELLSEEGISQTDAFVAITGLDEANILMALSAAKQSGDCCKVVAKINRKSLLELVSTESLIDSVVSTGAVTTELILQYIRAMKNASASKVKTLHRIVDEKVEALEFSVTPDISFAGVPLRDLNLKRGLLLAGIVRQNGQIVIPSGNDVLHLHDDVIVVTTDTQLEDLRDILAE